MDFSHLFLEINKNFSTMSQRICSKGRSLGYNLSKATGHQVLFQKPIFRAYATTHTDDSLLHQKPIRHPTSIASSSTSFEDRLKAGPTFSDFVTGNSEVIETANDASASDAITRAGSRKTKKQHTRLPTWLKTPIPVGDNYKRIKNDLRGLNLHTGKINISACFECRSLCT